MSDDATVTGPRAIERAIAALIGARVDKAFFCEATGLLCLGLFDGARKTLVVGLGPHVWGVGLGSAVPRVRDEASRPLVAALRAHIVDHRLRSASIEEDRLWLAFGGDGAIARLALAPGRRGGAIVFAADGRMIAKHPASQVHEPTSEWSDERPFASRGDAMVARSDRAGCERARLALARASRAARAANDRRAAAVRGDLARLGSVEQLQKIGRLLLAQGGSLAKGATTALLEDWEDGGQLEVTLDPSRPAKSQAETFFAKARRYQRGEAMMRKRLAECESRASALAALEQEIAAGDPSAHDEWRALVARARALGVKVEAASREADGASERAGADRSTKRAPFHVFRDERGRKILVGRGGRENDALTTQVARSQDLWLHAKGRAGAHVVVPLDKGQDCPSETLVDAATLAAHFSDARGEAVCEVSYVPRKYVRKRKGGPPGSVTFDHEKVLLLRVEPSRLERLLSTREE